MKRLVRVLAVAFLGVVALTACRPAPGGSPEPYPPPPDYVVSTVNAHFGDLGPGVVSCMTSIAWRESGYVAEADNGTHRGLFQSEWASSVWDNVNANLGLPAGWVRLFWQDPWLQGAVARSQYESWVQRGVSGFQPWIATRGGCR